LHERFTTKSLEWRAPGKRLGLHPGVGLSSTGVRQEVGHVSASSCFDVGRLPLRTILTIPAVVNFASGQAMRA